MAEPEPRRGPIPKLRASCDNCGASKLKCDRNQPECDRCVSLDVPCVYGISRRTRRHRGSRSEIAQRPESNFEGPRIEPITSQGLAGPRSGWNEPEVYPVTAAAKQVRSVLPLDSLGNYTPTASTVGISTAADINDDFWSYDSAFWDFMDTDVPEQGPSAAAVPSLVAPENLPRSDRQTQMRSKHSPYLDHAQHRRDTDDSHDCCYDACNIFLHLSIPRGSPSSLGGIDSSEDTDNIKARFHVFIDEILHRTNQAIRGLGRLLDCSCMGSPELLLIAAAVMARVLHLCQYASENCSEFLSSLPLPLSGSEKTSRSQSQVSSEGTSDEGQNWLLHTPSLSSTSSRTSVSADIISGTFRVDEARTEAALKLQMLVGEVRKLETLMEHYRASTATERHGTGSQLSRARLEELHDSLGAWLQNEHLRVKHLLKSELKSL